MGAHQYQFIHKSCQEFFAAQHIQDSLAQLHCAQEDLQAYFAQQVNPYQPAEREVATQEAKTYNHYATSCPPINQKLLKTEPAIIAFLQDGLWKRKVNIEGFTPSLLQQWLLHFIKASTEQSQSSHRSIQCHYPFGRANLIGRTSMAQYSDPRCGIRSGFLGPHQPTRSQSQWCQFAGSPFRRGAMPAGPSSGAGFWGVSLF